MKCLNLLESSCLYGFGRTPNLIVLMALIERQLLIIELNGNFVFL